MPKARRAIVCKSTGGIHPRRMLDSMRSPSPPEMKRVENYIQEANERHARANIKRVKKADILFELIDKTSILDVEFDSIHTVKDLYTFVNDARPEFTNIPYVLVRTQRFDDGDSEIGEGEDDELELTDLTLTLRDTDLLNSTITQRSVDQVYNVNPSFSGSGV